MGDIAEDLNYDYNYNMFLTKIMLPNLKTEDRQKAIRWIKKLSSCNRTIEEMRLRNDFMYFLVVNVQQGELLAPFTEPPPPSALPLIAHLLPGGVANPESDEFGGEGAHGAAPDVKQPLLYEHSPDGGAFLAAQPVPRCGAFCYLAVIAKSPHH